MIEEINIADLYEYLDEVRKKPGVFLGAKSITALHYFISGYQWACSLKSIKEELEPDFHGFHDFVADHFLYGESTAGWKNILLAENYCNEEKAFEEFFELFDSFRENIKPANSKKILFRIIEQLILNNNTSSKDINETPAYLHYFKDLPFKLQTVRFRSDYDHILNHFKELAGSDEALSTFINKMSE